MAFFISDNPIALFLALVLTVAIMKMVLGKVKFFQGKYAAYITLVLIAIIILLLLYQPLLKMLAIGLPFLILIVLLVFGLAAMFFALGMGKGTIWPMIKGIGLLKTTVQIVVVCIIAFAISQVYGDDLLEDKSVSFADPIMPSEETKQIDFSFLFTTQALGIIIMLIVLGFAFVWISCA
jgi:hypothetical protein